MEYAKRVSSVFGVPLLLGISSSSFGMKGLVTGTMGAAMLPYSRSYLKVEGTVSQRIATMMTVAWAMKGFIGCLSDTVSIRGYNKRWYLVSSSLLSVIACLSLASLPLSGSTSGTAWVEFCVFSISWGCATFDLLTEARYSRAMNDNPKSGSDLVTFNWFTLSIGGLIGASCVGVMADHVGPRAIFFVLAIVSALSGIPHLYNSFGEPPPRAPKCVDWNFGQFYSHKRIYYASITSALAALLMAIGNAMDMAVIPNFIMVMATTVVLFFVLYNCVPRIVANAAVYMVLNSATYVSLSGAMDYWFLAKKTCVPDGPGFSYEYYNTYTTLVGQFSSMVAIIIFQTYLSKGTYRRISMITIFLRMIASCFDIIIVKRVNIGLGIPDKMMYMFGDAIIAPTVDMLNFMPTTILISRLCPRGVEAVMYALLAGIANVGMVVSQTLGVTLINAFEIETSEPCNFDSLPMLIFLGHFVTASTMLLAAWWLLPTENMSDLISKDKKAPVVGSEEDDDDNCLAEYDSEKNDVEYDNQQEPKVVSGI